MTTTPAGSDRKVLALVPARGGSKRIPRKNILEFEGQPMLAYPLQAARESGLFHRIHVSTDDDEIAAVATRYGADTDPRRPADLADDHTPLLPVARWVLETFAKAGERYDDVFILFPCSPLLLPEDLIEAYRLYLAHGGRRNLLSVSRAPTFPEWLYHREDDGRLIPVHPGGAFIRSQELRPAYFETGTFTIFSARWLLESETFEDDTNYIGYELPAWRAVDIDTPEDLEMARLLFRAWKAQQRQARP